MSWQGVARSISVLSLCLALTLSCKPKADEKKAAPPATEVAPSEERCQGASPACLPDIDLKDTDGKVWKPADLVGKVVVINFWATWCAPCQAEVPDLAEAQRKYKEQGVLVFGMLAEQPVNEEALHAFQEKYGLDYPVIPVDKYSFEAFGEPRAMPTNFVYSRSGHLKFTAPGAIDLAGLEQALKALL